MQDHGFIKNSCYFRIWVHRNTSVEQTARNIKKLFDRDLSNEHSMRQFGKFCPGNFSLENKLHGWFESKVDNSTQKAVVETDIDHKLWAN